MLKLEYEQLRALANNQLCAQHKSPLEVVWHPDGFHTLKCHAGDHFPDALMRNPSLTELFNTGQLPPGPIEDNIKRREKRKTMSQARSNEKAEFALLPTKDLGNNEILVPVQIQALIDYASRYHLDPHRGHVVLMYGQPYIGLDGYLYHALREDPQYQLRSWPMTTLEKLQYQVGDYDYGWIAECFRSANKSAFTGIGVVTQEEINQPAKYDPKQKRYPVVASKPWQMAQKRAEWQALRRAFPIGETEGVKEE